MKKLMFAIALLAAIGGGAFAYNTLTAEPASACTGMNC
jgi:hypothetical protein